MEEGKVVECRVLEENGSAPRRRRLRGVRLFSYCRCLVFIWTTANQLEDWCHFTFIPTLACFIHLYAVKGYVVCNASRYANYDLPRQRSSKGTAKHSLTSKDIRIHNSAMAAENQITTAPRTPAGTETLLKLQSECRRYNVKKHKWYRKGHGAA